MKSLFDIPDEPKPPLAKRRVMMHVIDAGSGECVSEGEHIAVFECSRFGNKTGWITVKNISDGKRGIPCPNCNQKAE